jgi:hypothetical protein
VPVQRRRLVDPVGDVHLDAGAPLRPQGGTEIGPVEPPGVAGAGVDQLALAGGEPQVEHLATVLLDRRLGQLGDAEAVGEGQLAHVGIPAAAVEPHHGAGTQRRYDDDDDAANRQDPPPGAGEGIVAC